MSISAPSRSESLNRKNFGDCDASGLEEGEWARQELESGEALTVRQFKERARDDTSTRDAPTGAGSGSSQARQAPPQCVLRSSGGYESLIVPERCALFLTGVPSLARRHQLLLPALLSQPKPQPNNVALLLRRLLRLSPRLLIPWRDLLGVRLACGTGIRAVTRPNLDALICGSRSTGEAPSFGRPVTRGLGARLCSVLVCVYSLERACGFVRCCVCVPK
jgi:hypothetical protein